MGYTKKRHGHFFRKPIPENINFSKLFVANAQFKHLVIPPFRALLGHPVQNIF